MFVNFIYYRMLVDVAIFHGIIKKKKALPLTEGTHCLHATKIEKPLMFQIPPPPFTHCHYYLYIYLDFFFFSEFIFSICVSLATTDQTDGR